MKGGGHQVAPYPNFDMVWAKHERLVRWLARRRALRNTALCESADLEQDLRLVIVDVWQRHRRRGVPQSEMDRIIRTALTYTLVRVLRRHHHMFAGDQVGWLQQHIGGGVRYDQEWGDGYHRLYLACLEGWMVEQLSSLSRLLLRQLVSPSQQFQAALMRGRIGHGTLHPVARYFGVSPIMVASAVRELRGVFDHVTERPRRRALARYLL